MLSEKGKLQIYIYVCVPPDAELHYLFNPEIYLGVSVVNIQKHM